MPLPRKLVWREGSLSPTTVLEPVYPGTRTDRLADAAVQWLRERSAIIARPGAGSSTGDSSAGTNNRLATPATVGDERPLVVRVRSASAVFPALHDDEAYQLRVSSLGIELDSASEWGALRGFATLGQLLQADGTLPAVEIHDQPRFPWRGLMLDVARHFIGIEQLHAVVGHMARFKLNVLHLHLSDDQAFRFRSSAWPRLASGDSYSHQELAGLVAFAAVRGIRVIPELDMPGHVTSWLVAYPEWGCRPTAPTRRFGVHEACLDPTREELYPAIAALLGEVAAVFPDQYLHFGGDEVNPTWWSDTSAVQAYMQAHGYARAADLQAAFNARVVAIIADLGRKSLGWDEVLHPALPREVVVQAWRGATGRDRALASGHDCIVSANYYLDLYFPADIHYGFDPEAPVAELVALEDASEADPRLAHVAAGMRWTHHWREAAPEQVTGTPGRVLGGEACLWAEIVDAGTLDLRLWSRLPAIAERFWSPAEVRDRREMQRRRAGALKGLARAGLDVEALSRAFVTQAGVGNDWLPLIDQLEPVKWYARLLGEVALAARLSGREMPLARPYGVDTPLNRVVDGLLPEAPGARALSLLCERERGERLHPTPGGYLGQDESSGKIESAPAVDPDALTDSHRQPAALALRQLFETWRDLPPSGVGPVELEPLAARLAAIGTMFLDLQDGLRSPQEARELLAGMAAPSGELILACIPVLGEWLDARALASIASEA